MEKRIQNQEVIEQVETSDNTAQWESLSEFDLVLVGGGIGDTVL